MTRYVNKKIKILDEKFSIQLNKNIFEPNLTTILLIAEAQKVIKKNYKVLDLGCGNGWVVRKFKEYSLCDDAHGLDGATHMIKKAKVLDPEGTYLNENIELWNPDHKYDIIFSMETLY